MAFDTNVAAPSPAALDIKPPQVQSPLEAAAQFQQLRTGQLQQQGLQMENQQRQMQMDQMKALNAAYQSSLTVNPDGTADIDTGKLTHALAQGGQGSQIPGVLTATTAYKQKMTDLAKAQQEVGALQRDALGSMGSAGAAANNDPHYFMMLLQHAIAAHEVDQQTAAQWLGPLQQSLQQDPTGEQARGLVAGYTGQMIAGSDKQRTLANQALTARGAGQRGQAAMSQADRANAQQDFQNAIGDLSANPPQSAQEYAQRVGKLSPANAMRIFGAVPVSQYDPTKSAQSLRQLGMTPDQQAQTQNQAAQLAETIKRDAAAQQHNLADESIQRVRTAVDQGRLGQEQMVNGMKYGPGTTEYWVKQLQDNPDSIKEMPPELRSTVGKGFTAATNLPLPTPASPAAQTQETAARNALDGVGFIRQALQNPEIRSQIGPIMGRLGNAEQSVGTAVGLSPQAEQLAQELRTRMRYFVFQEGKAVLGGRLPQQLMGALESSSANVKMDPNMLVGALNGAENNAQSIMDNVDKQRFGGQARPRTMRGMGGATPSPTAPAAGGGSTKTYTQADVDAAVAAHPGLTAAQADAAFKAKGWAKQ